MRRCVGEVRIRLCALAKRREQKRIRRLRLRSNQPKKSRSIFNVRRPRNVDILAFEMSCDGIGRIEPTSSFMVDNRGARLRCLSLNAPSDFRFSENPDGILRFIYELRRQTFVNHRFRRRPRKRRPSLYINLDSIIDVDLQGALILSAEFDRLRRILGFKPMIYDDNWDPWVRAVLHALGFYDVIDAARASGVALVDNFAAKLESQGVVIIPFISGSQADGEQALKLRTALYAACEPPSDARRPIYDALMEAFTNAAMHAYPEDISGDGLPRVGRWWAGALVDRNDGEFVLTVYDQGVGIPATLPRRSVWSIVQAKLPENTDEAVIKGALEYGRSSSDASGRGNGLWRMCELTNAFEFAEVTFNSLKGSVTYKKGGDMELAKLGTRFSGTMVVWRAEIPPRELAA